MNTRQEYKDRVFYVRRCAINLIDEKNYDNPEKAYKECYHASLELQNRLGKFVSFLVEARVFPDFEGTPWDGSEYDFVWHWTLVVSKVGIVDITGSQLGNRPLRILNSVPNNWGKVRKILPSENAPELEEIRSYLRWDGEYNKEEVFRPLLRVCQVRPFVNKKAGYYKEKVGLPYD